MNRSFISLIMFSLFIFLLGIIISFLYLPLNSSDIISTIVNDLGNSQLLFPSSNDHPRHKNNIPVNDQDNITYILNVTYRNHTHKAIKSLDTIYQATTAMSAKFRLAILIVSD